MSILSDFKNRLRSVFVTFGIVGKVAGLMQN